MSPYTFLLVIVMFDISLAITYFNKKSPTNYAVYAWVALLAVGSHTYYLSHFAGDIVRWIQILVAVITIIWMVIVIVCFEKLGMLGPVFVKPKSTE